MKDPLATLFPRPHRCSRTSGELELPAEPEIRVRSSAPSALVAARRVAAELEACGLRPRVTTEGGSTAGGIDLWVEPGPRPESYRLDIGREGILVEGADEAGLFYGAATLAQWIRAASAEPEGPLVLPGLSAEDWPDVPHRGVLLDISRNRVPTFETACDLVDQLAGWKVNQLQLYMEHTFAYRGHEVVWRDASPWTAEEIRALDAYCRDRCVELVPNQNSFGHFHRWLVHEPYRRLAECPEGIEHPFSPEPEPFSLCPIDPGTLELLADLYDQLLPCFTSRQLNVGCDETLDLGRCRSAAVCAERGRGEVYVDFLRQVHGLVAERGRRMQLWGDIILERPDLIGQLPPDAILLEWGYEADHPFSDHCRRFAAAGLDFYVCPGTSSWNSLAGRTRNALLNLAAAAREGREAGARGLLITDWGDFGHLQPLPVSYLGFLAGAGFAWNTASAEDPLGLPIIDLLDLHALRDRNGVTGRALAMLGDTYLWTGAAPKNGTALFFLLLFPQDDLGHRRYRGLTVQGLNDALDYIQDTTALLHRAQMDRKDAGLIQREIAWVADLLRLACRLGLARLSAGAAVPVDQLPSSQRAPLHRNLQELIERLPEIWLARSRPGGLAASQGNLGRLLAQLGA